MDLDLTADQQALSNNLKQILSRAWPALVSGRRHDRDPVALWSTLREFGTFDVGNGPDSFGAVECLLVSRLLGEHLVDAPFNGVAALLLASDAAFDLSAPVAVAEDVDVHPGDRVRVEFTTDAGQFAVVTADDQVFVAARDEVKVAAAWSVDPSLQPGVLEWDAAGTASSVDRLRFEQIGAVLSAGEAVGAAQTVFDIARTYAGDRRQFGRPIGSFQSLQHLLADAYVNIESSWSSALYAATSLDEQIDGAELAVHVAKAHASRATLAVAHTAMQVLGGIAFTEEHPAHLYLRRITARGQSYGNASAHERAITSGLALRG